MTTPDLQGPYDDFIERLGDIRKIVCSIESCYRSPGAITSTRLNVNLSEIRPATSINANSMALVFLASSYEEFVREEISECARLLSCKYPYLPDQIRHSIRNSYWSTTLQRLSYTKSILTKVNPIIPDATILTKIRPMLDIAQRFVINDDPSLMDAATAIHHSNNFRPNVVDEISKRIGIPNLIRRTAEGTKIKTYFGVATAHAAEKSLRIKLDDFYDRRNEIVHSLNSTSGYGVDFVLDWISLFDGVADSMKDALARAIATW